jgi:hypothetical protein
MRIGSPTQHSESPSSSSQRSERPRSAASEAKTRTVSSRSEGSEKTICSSFSLPASIFEKSRMSLMVASRICPESRITSRYSGAGSWSFCDSSSVVAPRMPLMGVRISWLMFARNWDLSRAIFSASSRVATSCCSKVLRSEMSVSMAMKFVSVREASKTGCTSISTQYGRPVRW